MLRDIMEWWGGGLLNAYPTKYLQITGGVIVPIVTILLHLAVTSSFAKRGIFLVTELAAGCLVLGRV